MNESEIDSINAFLFTCHQLKATALGKQFTISPTRTYRIQPNTPYSTRIRKGFSVDEWKSFLVSFRKLVLNDDPGNLFRVLNILSRNGRKNDQLRIREIKKSLKVAEVSPGYGIQIGVRDDGSWRPMNGRKILDSYLNEVVFHNDARSISSKRLNEGAHPLSMTAMFHYVIYAYKQALRVEGAVRIRHDL
tara:strand:- start:110 stop:679 length:570 start_codon:yes stop_codon:yes gene_type:complete